MYITCNRLKSVSVPDRVFTRVWPRGFEGMAMMTLYRWTHVWSNAHGSGNVGVLRKSKKHRTHAHRTLLCGFLNSIYMVIR
ncbi:hypothetical protein HanHA300_Chr12g0453171 [Helianthus annuus]|nr:hypothetical protein HanHA300_Chr12g0453171 [Helianthus annuus]KAJ0506157.1 hypothetical protein HanHA89_Chr12g0478761 [Helianthus annuus]KAJ0675828.1 hypothetical protein HanLR1_Chr12g0455661 [Helianthus annuus]